MDKKSVGLIVFTRMQSMGTIAVLRERGNFNFEKMKPESLPGGCQVTVHGKVEEGETFKEALLREVQEELGETFFNLFHLKIKEEFEKKNFYSKSKTVQTFSLLVENYLLLKGVRLDSSTGSIRLIKEKEICNIKDITEFSKSVGVIDRREITMFPDEIEALEKGFKRFR